MTASTSENLNSEPLGKSIAVKARTNLNLKLPDMLISIIWHELLELVRVNIIFNYHYFNLMFRSRRKVCHVETTDICVAVQLIISSDCV